MKEFMSNKWTWVVLALLAFGLVGIIATKNSSHEIPVPKPAIEAPIPK